MPQQSQIRTDKLLQDASQRFQNKQLIAKDFAPTVKVKDRTGKWLSYDKDNLRIPNSVWPAHGEAHVSDFNYTQNSYGPIVRRGLMEVVDREDVSQQEPVVDLRMDTTLNLTDQLETEREKDLADTLSGATLPTNHFPTISGTSQWNNPSTSNPFSDVTTAQDYIMQDALVEANMAIAPWQVWQQLKMHPLVLSKIQPTQLPIVTTDLVASLMKLEKILLAPAQYVSSNIGATTLTSAYIWGKYFYVGYVTPTPGKRAINGVYTLEVAPGKQVESENDWNVAGEKIRVSWSYLHKIFAGEALYRMATAVA